MPHSISVNPNTMYNVVHVCSTCTWVNKLSTDSQKFLITDNVVDVFSTAPFITILLQVHQGQENGDEGASKVRMINNFH